ncbi:putative integral membrane protein that interacts with FtsH [Staphylococcus saccharolyticus]|uniref:Putative integral membrane protein that interacts with FtsH n=1 Tax=Staphylococcus saccharolyticus TaxID=33028 RepID=A0A380HB62_9STAP|nr:putative integral membrane protein that interacts with FtsH [Staphylococcus saccharolyticus]
MSHTPQHVNDTNSQSEAKHQSHAYGKVWLFFMYYWIIFGIGCYFGQFVPMSLRKPLSIGLLVLLLATLFIKHASTHVNMD